MDFFKAVIFDLDGVLTETSKQHFIAWKTLADRLGFVLKEEVNEKLKGVSRMKSLDIVLNAGNMPDKFNDAEKLMLADEKNSIYKSLIKNFSKKNLSEGALELLTELKGNHIMIALASASKNAEFLIRAMQIEDLFDAVVNPESVKRPKPAPDIFLNAAQQLNVSAKNCIGIEDAFAGIEAIKNANMLPIGIGRKEELYNCQLVYNSLKELSFKRLNIEIENMYNSKIPIK